MKKSGLFVLMLVILGACEKYPLSNSETQEWLGFGVSGNYQSAEAGNYLPDSIGIVFDNQAVLLKNGNTFKIEFEVVEGGGTVDEPVLYSNFSSNTQGRLFTRWKLGTDSNNQVIKATFYDSNGKYLTETQWYATAYFTNDWNSITSTPLLGIQDMVYDTILQKSMLISNGHLYQSTDKFYKWTPVAFPFYTNVKEMEISTTGEIFVAGWDGTLYKTEDWGENWSELENPIPDNHYNYELTITKEDYIWANKQDYGVYCSKDNGLTWQKDTAGLENQERLGRIYSFADSAHMAISHYNMKILQTTNDGLSWEPVNTPEYSSTMFITDENEIIAQNQNGFNLHKSVDGGETYRKVFSTSVAYGTTSIHCYHKFGDDYYVLAPGGGVWKTKDFENFEKQILFDRQSFLFFDHRGTIYACGHNYSNAQEPTLIYPGKD
ncbi:sialidase family protein [Maribellus maritimus]|uniref:sialidase family protein n=1 Tax=Maribellus maritimus TaxID=2870838 RepID=UPI001EE9B196|nr:hypothetical protein [Maribellus maritimus]MCG6188646.1 hypothetical protein [Maribellus maritimus]